MALIDLNHHPVVRIAGSGSGDAYTCMKLRWYCFDIWYTKAISIGSWDPPIQGKRSRFQLRDGVTCIWCADIHQLFYCVIVGRYK
jgi:hypothetical protein